MNVFLLKSPCAQCPFTTDLGLQPGRLQEIVKDCRKKDSPFICHKSIYESKVEVEDDEEEEEDDESSTQTKIVFEQHVACRGYYNTNKRSPGAVIQIAQRLGYLREVDDPTDPYAKGDTPNGENVHVPRGRKDSRPRIQKRVDAGLQRARLPRKRSRTST